MIRSTARRLVTAVIRNLLVAVALVVAPTLAPAADLAIVGARILTSPDAAPIDAGTVLVRNGRIAEVGTRVRVPRGTPTIDAKGLTLTAGFWNSHVHFLPEGFLDAASQPPETLAKLLRDMFLRWGFTHVVDLASQLEDGLALRRRIESGEIDGPGILTCDNPFFPQGGTPIYVRETYQRHGWNDEVATPAEAGARATEQLRRGSDCVKLFTGAIVGRPVGVQPMSVDIAAAAVAAAVAAGKPAFAHPTDPRGIRIALDAGVTVLAHTTPTEGTWPQALAAELAARKVALVPTLTLLQVALEQDGAPQPMIDRMMADAQQQVRATVTAGGDILFGTDVGFIDEADTTREFRLMAGARLDYRSILRSLTTAPSTRFGGGERGGRIERGQPADLVLLGGDPTRNVDAFADVRYTIRGGRTIFSAHNASAAPIAAK
jgi:imidazolonepropionase-like amidohydrolase